MDLIFVACDLLALWQELDSCVYFNKKNRRKIWQSQNLQLIITCSSWYPILLLATTHPKTIVTRFSSTLFHAKTNYHKSSLSIKFTLPFGKALLVAGLNTYILITCVRGICSTDLFASLGLWTCKTTIKIWCMNKKSDLTIFSTETRKECNAWSMNLTYD